MMKTKAMAMILAIVAIVAAIAVCEDARCEIDPAVPLIVVEAGGALGADEIDAVARAIRAPVARGERIRRRVGIVAPLPASDATALLDSFERAKDLFYRGDHREAYEAFESVHARGLVALRSACEATGLREAVFEAALFCAMIEGKGEGATEWIARAAARFPDLSPSSESFPPWMREDHTRVRAAAGSVQGSVELDAPPGCELVVEGRIIEGAARAATGLGAGERVVAARCHGRMSVPVSVEVGPMPVRFAPITLSHTAMAAGEELTLTAEPAVDDGDLIEDAAKVAAGGGWDRAVVVVARSEKTAVWLVATPSGAPLRTIERAGTGPEEIESRVAAIVPEIDPSRDADDVREPGGRRWFENGAAWTLLGGGLAAMGAGLALGRVYGGPSKQEPLAWALMAGGGVIAGTGFALFFVPARSEGPGPARDRGIAFGVAGAASF